MRSYPIENTPFYGKWRTEETCRKMSEAAKHTRERSGGYKLLITAVIRQAIKDNAIDFLESETGKYYCSIVGVTPDNLKRGRI